MKIKDIAKLANVSVSAVSKVLMNHSDVSQSTRDEILKIMDQVDFRPQRIRSTYNIIAYICDDQSQYESSFGSRILSGITKSAFFSGYRIMLVPYEKEFRSRTYFKQMMRSSGIAGVICFLNKTDEAFYQTLVHAEVPHIIFQTKTDSASQSNWIKIDNAGGGYQAAAHLISHGHRRVGVIGRPGREDDEARIVGCAQALAEIQENLFCQFSDDNQGGQFEKQVKEVLLSKNRPTAIFSTNYLSTIKFLKVVGELGYEVPQYISLISFGDYEFTSHLKPPLSSIKIPAKEMGELAVESLLSIIKGSKDNIQLNINTELVVRKSVGTIN